MRTGAFLVLKTGAAFGLLVRLRAVSVAFRFVFLEVSKVALCPVDREAVLGTGMGLMEAVVA